MVLHPDKNEHRSGNEKPEGQGAPKVIPYPQSPGSPKVSVPDGTQRSTTLGENHSDMDMDAAAERQVEEWRVIAAVLQGDVLEFRTLVQRYQNPIYHLMLRVTRQPMAAEDLTQDAFARSYEKLGTFKKGKRYFSWLYAIATNIGRDYLRRKSLQSDIFSTKALDAAWPDPNHDDCANKPDCVMEVRQISDALSHLPARYSETMLLYYREGLSAKEIAAALQISTAAVKVRIYRGRKLLKEQLGGNDETR